MGTPCPSASWTRTAAHGQGPGSARTPRQEGATAAGARMPRLRPARTHAPLEDVVDGGVEERLVLRVHVVNPLEAPDHLLRAREEVLLPCGERGRGGVRRRDRTAPTALPPRARESTHRRRRRSASTSQRCRASSSPSSAGERRATPSESSKRASSRTGTPQFTQAARAPSPRAAAGAPGPRRSGTC